MHRSVQLCKCLTPSLISMEDTDVPDGANSEMSRQFQSEDSQNDLISVETGLLSYLIFAVVYLHCNVLVVISLVVTKI